MSVIQVADTGLLYNGIIPVPSPVIPVSGHWNDTISMNIALNL
ncbi:hypothetical protein [Wolbachia endosymbiont (group B) of Limnophora tigrina]